MDLRNSISVSWCNLRQVVCTFSNNKPERVRGRVIVWCNRVKLRCDVVVEWSDRVVQ